MTVHLKYGGSTAGRLIGCPGWLDQSKNIPKSTSSYAQAGTALHTCFEEMLLEDAEPRSFAGRKVEGVLITQEMADEILHPALFEFQRLCNDYSVTEFESETFCQVDDETGGTADFVARGKWGGEDIGIVGDLKTGKGIQVFPENNPQALFYTWAVLQKSDAKDLLEGCNLFAAVIIQPNDQGLNDLRIWHFTAEELAEFIVKYQRAQKESKMPRPPIAAGEHCKFCPAAPICPEKTGQAMTALKMDPEDLKQLSNSMDLVRDLKVWISDVERTAFEQLEAGAVVKNWKLVAKRATEKWIDENEALLALRRKLGGQKNITTLKLATPAQMRKIIKAQGKDIDMMAELTVKNSSGNTLAPEDDKRPAVLQGDQVRAAIAAEAEKHDKQS